MPKGYMYILECSEGTFYTGSTIDLEGRINQHNSGEGANYTKTRLPIRLLYIESYDRIDEAFNREKQIQNWSHSKKSALINSETNELQKLAECQNEFHAKNHR